MNWIEIVIGCGSLVIGIVLWVVKLGEIGSIFIGVGLPIILRAFINWKNSIDLIGNTIKKWRDETKKTTLNIRKLQSITFNIHWYNHYGVEYLLLKCEHEYTYEYGSCEEKKIDINTFNDLAIPFEENEQLPNDKRTRFIQVSVKKNDGDEETYHYNDPILKNCFGTDDHNRPKFTSPSAIKLNKNQNVKINFEINNTHRLKSSHFWYFEQISERLTITINDQTDDTIFLNKNFALIINHPMSEEIQKHNKDYLNTDGKLKGKRSVIKIPYVFLPFQGFELSWDLEAGNDICQPTKS